MASRAMRPRPKPSSPTGVNGTMIALTLEVGGKVREYKISPTKLPLVFMEALEEMEESGRWGNMRLGIQKLLKLTDEESLELETDHLMQIAEAIKRARDIPNG